MFLLFDTIAVPLDRVASVKLAHYHANSDTGKNDVYVCVQFRGTECAHETIKIGEVPAGPNAWQESQKLFQIWAKSVLPQAIGVKNRWAGSTVVIGGVPINFQTPERGCGVFPEPKRESWGEWFARWMGRGSYHVGQTAYAEGKGTACESTGNR